MANPVAESKDVTPNAWGNITRTTVLLVVLLALAVMIGACGGGATSSSTASAPSATATTESARSDPTPASTSLPTPPGSEEVLGREYPSIQPSISKVTEFHTVIEYGQVPEDFLPEMPEMDKFEESVYISMEKSLKGSLKALRITPFSLAQSWTGDGINLPPDYYQGSTRRILEEDFSAAVDQGARLLRCFYVTDEYVSLTADFWLGSTPNGLDPDRLRDRLPNHPIVENIVGAADQCPARLEEEIETLKAYQQVLWGNWDSLLREKQPGYIHLEYRHTAADGLTDVYDFFDYNTSRGIPVLLGKGTLTVNADGVGYVEMPGFDVCRYKYGGEITFYPEGEKIQFDATFNCLSPSGEITGRNQVNISYQRR